MNIKELVSDPYAELQIINAILSNNKYYDEAGLQVFDFTDLKHREAFRIISEAIEKGEAADQNLLSHSVEQGNKVFGIEYVANLEPIANNVRFYAKKITDASARRGIRTAIEWIKDNYDREPLEVIEGIDRRMSEIVGRGTESIQHSRDTIGDTIDEMETLSKKAGQLYGTNTGYGALNDVTNGFVPGELIIIAARPSVGKTTFGINLLTKQAVKNKIPAGFISCEMAIKHLNIKILSNLASVEIGKIRSGRLTQKDIDKLGFEANRLRESPIYWYRAKNAELNIIKSKIRQMARKGVKVVYVDYLTLVKYMDASLSRHERVGLISKELKSLAEELDISVVALSQVGRQTEGKMPSIADLRQSGEIEEDADVIIFLHREKRDDETTRVKVAKHRNGPVGEVNFIFMQRYQKFEVLSSEDYKEGGE